MTDHNARQAGLTEALHYLQMGIANLELGNGVHMVDFRNAERAVLAAQALTNDARECLQDVVSHHNSFRMACQTLWAQFTKDGDKDSADYWTHEMGVLDRMKAQAERAAHSADARNGEPTPAQSISDAMMDLADRLGSESKDVDPRAWRHLLVYAPARNGEGVALRAALQRLEAACDRRSRLLTADAYNAASGLPGMTDALLELDEARKEARALLAAPAEEARGVAALWVRTQTITDDRGYAIGMDEPELRFGATRPEGEGWEPFYRAAPAAPAPIDELGMTEADWQRVDAEAEATGLIDRLAFHCEDKANTAFARSTMREALQLLTAAPAPAAQADEASKVDELPLVANTLGGFRGGWIALHGHPPQDQDIWNAGVRSGMSRQQSTAPADAASEAGADTPPCKGMNCGATDGSSHSLECQAEHAAAIAGGRFAK